jgi:phage repressor protein C with HTH and peptisase S24 domain
MNTVRERLILYVKSKNKTIASFEREIGVSSGYIKNISRSIQPDILENIANLYPDLNIEWLMIGKGEMLKSGYTQTDGVISVANEARGEYQVQRKSIPLVTDLSATCGVPDGFSIAIKRDDCTPLLIPGIKGDFAIRAKGRSMINRQNPEQSINENNIIICNRWISRTHIRWGEVYALATNDGIVVKQLQPSEKEGFVRCVSFNSEDGFKPYDLPVTEISDWAIVIGVINISMFA